MKYAETHTFTIRSILRVCENDLWIKETCKLFNGCFVRDDGSTDMHDGKLHANDDDRNFLNVFETLYEYAHRVDYGSTWL